MSVESTAVNVVNAAVEVPVVRVKMSVASAAVGSASGCETENTGVKLRPGCIWRSGPYWC